MNASHRYWRIGLSVLFAGLVALPTRVLSAAPTSQPALAPAIFVLPSEPSPWLLDRRVAVFTERLLIALARDGLVRTLSERDIPTSSRAALPADLSTCTSAGCIKMLGRATGARIVFQTRVLADAEDLIVFATILDGKAGEVVAKKELGRLETKRDWKTMPEDAARWVLEKTGVVSPKEAAVVPKPAAPSSQAGQSGIDIEIAADQKERSEARWLRDGLRRSLAESGGLPVAAAPGATSGAPFSHRATVTVEHMAIVQRTHHVRHYRDGQLTATLTIVDKSTGQTVFVRRAESNVSETVEHSNDQSVLGMLVDNVVRDWMSYYDSENVPSKIRKTNP